MSNKVSKIKNLIFAASFLLWAIPVFATAGTMTGSGTAADPYIIYDNDDWSTFATNVWNKIDADKYYKLSDDFNDYNTSENPITRMCGTTNNPFKGNFDGNGKTLNVSYSNTTECIAPFRYASDATFNRLTVTGKITTSGMNAGGFVGCARGTITLNNCISSVEIESSVSGDGSHGGFFGRTEEDQKFYFNNCLFNGKLLGANITSCGGFVGWRDGGFIYFSNCLFAPVEVTMAAKDSCTFNRHWDSSLDNCYYTEPFGTPQGKKSAGKSNEELLALLGDNWQITDNALVPVQTSNCIFLGSITELEHYYSYTGNPVLFNYSLLSFDGQLLNKDIDYSVIIKKDSGITVADAVEKGVYTIIFKGKGNYIGSKEASFKVIYAGAGTKTDPYLIETTFDWNIISEKYNTTTHESSSGKYFRLENDLDFGGEEGSFNNIANANGNDLPGSTLYYFAGVFDGNSHSLSGISCGCNGVFGLITSRAVVKNLTIKNSTIRGVRRTGGVVGINYGTVTNCHTTDDVFVYSAGTPNWGDDSNVYAHGGVVGWNMSGAVVSGCTSAANVVSNHSDNINFGGILGYNNGGTVKHCFYYGNNLKSADGKPGAIIGYNSSGTIKENLHISNYGGVNGSNNSNANRAYKLAIGTENISLNATSESAINYGEVTAVSGTLNFNNIIYAPAGQVLTLDFIYDEQIFNEGKPAFDYVYKSSTETVSQTCTPDSEGKYSFEMPSTDVIFYAGYDWEGAGSQDSPYIMNHINQIRFLATRVNILEKTYDGKYFRLENNLEFNSSEDNLIPIGGIFDGENREFCGTFDGNGKSIGGLKINTSAASEQNSYAGLFGILGTNAVVKNLTIKNSQISGAFACGAVAGYNTGTISDCIVESDVEVSSQNAASSCHGGVAGYNTGTINKCNSSAKVNNASAAGGIAGYNKNGTVTDCFYEEKSTAAINTNNSYSGFIIGHDQNGILSGNYCIGKVLKAIGLASSGIDVTGARRFYKIESQLVDNLCFVQNEQGEHDFECLIYPSNLYAPAGSTVKLNLNSFTLEEGSELVLNAVEKNTLSFNISSFANGICAFTMPAYDVSLVIKTTEISQGQTGPDPNENTEIEPAEIILALQKDPYTKNIYYASFYNPRKAYKVPKGTKVFYVIKTGNNKLDIEEETSGIINAGEPVILQSTSENITLVLTEQSGSYSYTNILRGTESIINAPQNAYVLGFSIKGGVGFYKATGTIAAGKAYLLKEDQSE